MNAVDGMACATPGCDNCGKPGLNIVGHGSFGEHPTELERHRHGGRSLSTCSCDGRSLSRDRPAQRHWHNRAADVLVAARTTNGGLINSEWRKHQSNPGRRSSAGLCGIDRRPKRGSYSCTDPWLAGSAATRHTHRMALEAAGHSVPHPVLWTQVNATPPGVARAPRGPRSACDTRASRAARSCCTAPRTRSLRRVPP